jgi:hypothetical protein
MLFSFPNPPLLKGEGGGLLFQLIGGLNFRSLNAFVTTVTDENAIAPAARMGLRRMPRNGKRIPAATGMRMVL